MSTTTMHFGPEWMRTKHQPTPRPQHPPSPPPANGLSTSTSGTSTYSSLVSATPPAPLDKIDDAHPFRYSKEELLAIYHEGGGKGGLGLEVERWEGVVREVATDPIGLREMTESEKKLFAGPLNSEMRRRPSQSTEFLSPLNTSVERPRMMHSASATTNSPLRERFGGIKRRESSGGTTEHSSIPIPRKPSISALQSPGGMHSPRDSGPPRTRAGYTSNFDGVLNSGESWVARRRASEVSMKPGTIRDGQISEQAPMNSGIREEREDDPPAAGQQVNGGGHSSVTSSSPDYHANHATNPVTSNGGPQTGTGAAVAPSGNGNINGVPPPGLFDPNNVEWQYKDPTGQVQGPFKAEVMHSWQKGGYFVLDLPMKRTSDDNWFTLQVLINQATTENIFLTPPMPAPPPGLNHNSPIRSFLTPEQVYNEPYQPAPIRSLRTSTLESFVGSSDSPSSSFGASQFGNPSPDPSAFGGRDNRPYFGNEVNGRTGFGLHNPHLSPFPTNSLGSLEYSHDVGGKMQAPLYSAYLNGNTSNNPLGISAEPWALNSGVQSTFGLGLPSSGLPSHLEQSQNVFGQDVAGRSYSQSSTGGSYADSLNQHHGGMHLGYSSQFDPAPGVPYGAIPDQGQQYAAQMPDFNLGRHPASFGQHSLESISSKPTQEAPQSPWDTIPGPVLASALPVVEEPHPIESQLSNSASVALSDTKANLANDFTALKVAADLPGTADQKASLDESDSHTAAETASTAESLPPTAPEPSTKRSKRSKTNAKQPIEAGSPAPVEQASTLKFAWAKDEALKKNKGATSSVSLRDIQEAEAKKQESRKAAEREKERARATNVVVEVMEEAQPFSAAWGLPTSQAGNRNGTPLSVREPPATTPSSATTPATPVWAAPPKTPTVKKTMKEIQEEEEKRKKQVAAKESAVAAAQRRAYAESTSKAAASPAPVAAVVTNSVWTTVGASGKTSAATIAAANLPARPPPPSATTSSTRVTNNATQRSASSSTPKTRPATKADEITDTPSHEFLKWLGDSLKGLNNSVNVEEIMSMLLSFPIDADSSTQEIISDTIYANSTTLDGRRFASEFVTKRKTDAAARPKNGASNNSKASAKPVSIADVVKSVPKPAQPEWGFKVVNKKKKGGRT